MEKLDKEGVRELLV